MTELLKLEDRVRAAVQPVDSYYRQNGLGEFINELSVTHETYKFSFSWIQSEDPYDVELVNRIAYYMGLEEIQRGQEVAEIFVVYAEVTAGTLEDETVVFEVDITLDVRFND